MVGPGLGTQAVLERFAAFDGQTATADFKIVHGNSEWPVHRMILALHSKVLERACFGTFKEGSEAKLDLTSAPRCIVPALVHYFYHMDYIVGLPDKTQTPIEASDPRTNDAMAFDDDNLQPIGELSFHVKMGLLGDYYDMKHLLSAAMTKAASILRHPKAAVDNKDLHQAARLAYQARSATGDFCVSLVQYLQKSETLFVDDAQGVVLGEVMLDSIPALAKDYMRAMRASLDGAANDLAKRGYKCPEADCGEVCFMDIHPDYEWYECDYCCQSRMGTEWTPLKVSPMRPLEDADVGDWWQD